MIAAKYIKTYTVSRCTSNNGVPVPTRTYLIRLDDDRQQRERETLQDTRDDAQTTNILVRHWLENYNSYVKAGTNKREATPRTEETSKGDDIMMFVKKYSTAIHSLRGFVTRNDSIAHDLIFSLTY